MLAKGGVWQAPRHVNVVLATNAAILTTPNSAVFIADADYEVQSVAESHSVLGTDGSAVALDVVKCTGTQTAAQGTSLLASTFNLKATINTVVRKDQGNGGLLVTTAKSKLKLAKGDRLAFSFSGTLTAVTGLCVTIVLLPAKTKPRW